MPRRVEVRTQECSSYTKGTMPKQPLRKRIITRAPEMEHTPARCRAREMLDRVGDRWSVYVISALGAYGTLRFGELMQQVEGVSQRMLTVTVRGLERDGLVRRTIYAEIPPRVEYTLTPLGATLRKLVRELIDWTGAHLAEVDAARARYDLLHQKH
jgi:DNA-binding HxlR family transcriptional regulator